MQRDRRSFDRLMIIILLLANGFSGCLKQNNPVGPSNPIIWTQEELRNFEISGVYAMGGVLIVGTSLPLSSCVYIFRSTDDGSTWLRTDSIHVDNHDPNTTLWISPSTTFFFDGTCLFIGIGGLSRGGICRSNDSGLIWTSNGISWPESGVNWTERLFFLLCRWVHVRWD